jgi:rubrerythrin
MGGVLMNKFSSVEAVLDRAIEEEQESFALYTTLAGAVKNAAVRARLQELAAMELGHQAKLQEAKAGNVRWAIRRAKAEPVTDLRLTDHLEAKPLDANADYQDVLLSAARREKTAHDFYQAMLEMVDDPLVKGIFEMLAREELRHKYALEKIYEEVVYQAN